MKPILRIVATMLVLCGCYLSCTKRQNDFNVKPSSPVSGDLVQDAIHYFDDSVRNRPGPAQSPGDSAIGTFNPVRALAKQPDWDKAYVLRTSIGDVVVAPLVFQDHYYAQPSNTDGKTRLLINSLCKLIVYKDSANHFHAEVVSAFPDQNFLQHPRGSYSGIAFIQSWQGDFLKSFRYQNGGVKSLRVGSAGSTGSPSAHPSVAPASAPVTGDCYETDWYNCGGTVDDPYQDCSYLYSTFSGCDGGGGDGGGPAAPGPADYGVIGGSGSTATPVSVDFTFASPTTPTDIKQEMKCFTANPSSTYYITINVEEPGPGSGASFASGPLQAGHTYLSFEQYNSDGTAVVRNDGFYPATSANPISPGAPSTFGDNSNDPVSAKLKIAVSAADFITAVQREQTQTDNHSYNLYTYNCSTAALDVLSSFGISGLDQYVAGSIFTGNYPGNLGTTIRNLDLDIFSQLNGGRQMWRNTAPRNIYQPPAKQGTCN
jgi:hypothetical protein